MIPTVTLFCRSFWHLIWKYIYICIAKRVALVAVPLPPTQALQLLFPKAGQRISDGKRHLRVKANANVQPRPIVQRPNAVAANGFKQMSRPPQILKKGPEPSVCYGKRNMCFWPVGAVHDGIHAGSKWHLGKRTHCNAVQFTLPKIQTFKTL